MTISESLLVEIPVWEYANGIPSSTGIIKANPEDFIVEEYLSFQPEGSGEHSFLYIEKKGENTEFVAKTLAQFANVKQRDVSFAGLKDRHAITRQWFSIWLPGKEDPDWKILESNTIKILQITRHARKLKRGALFGNRFNILITGLEGKIQQIEARLQFIKEQGFPNYFGLQRFGNQGQNINKAIALFQGTKVKREQKSLYLSAARSYIFNQLLSKRIALGNWNIPILGDCFSFDQSNSYFVTNQIDSALVKRVKKGEIHPTGLMFGIDELKTTDEAFKLESSIIDENLNLAAGLRKFGLASDRRALRVFARNLEWDFPQETNLMLRFTLPAGSYATALLRELVITSH